MREIEVIEVPLVSGGLTLPREGMVAQPPILRLPPGGSYPIEPHLPYPA